MKKILIDTDVLIDYSKGTNMVLEKLLEKQSTGEAELVLSPVNVTEFLNNQSLVQPSSFARANEFLDYFKVVDIDKEVGRIAARILREKSTAYLGDALIAAVCLKNELTIFTRNKKHFEKIKGIRIASSNFF